MTTISTKMKALGFEEHPTGGGCMAYRREKDAEHYWLVTDQHGAELPESLDETALIGLHRYDQGEEVSLDGGTLNRLLVRWWFDRMAAEIGRGYHPDTPFDDYVGRDGNRSFSGEQALALEKEQNAIILLCDDQYAEAVAAMERAGLIPRDADEALREAAPDLLAALEGLVALHDYSGVKGWRPNKQWWLDARSAIAKAKGGRG